MILVPSFFRLRTPQPGWRADLCAGLLGALSALALPPLFALPVLLLAMPGLLALLDAAPEWRTAARRGLWFGFGHHVVGLYWITGAILIEARDYWWFVPIAVPGLAMVLAPFVAFACGIARCAQPGWRRVAALAGAWVLGDLARQFIGTGFPWNLWGSVWALPGEPGDILIQPAAWIGAHGLTLLTVWLACAPRLGRRAMAAGAAGLAIWAGAGAWRLSRPLPPPPGLQAVLAQGAVPKDAKWDADRARAIFDRYLDMTRAGMRLVGVAPAIVVWPESSFPGLLERDADARRMIAQAAAPARAALVGSVRFPMLSESEQAGAAPGAMPAGRPRNSLVAVAPDGRVGGVYDKWHLVPGGEYAPSWLPFAVGIVPGGGFARGPGPRTLRLPGLPPIGALICYEAIFPAQVSDPADRPALLVNITNDAWFGDSFGPRQHLAAARLRAVEAGLPLLRAANTGISAVFDPRGHEVARLEMGRRDVLIAPAPPALPPTLFARAGLLAPGSLAVASLLAGLVGSRRKSPDRRIRRLD